MHHSHTLETTGAAQSREVYLDELDGKATEAAHKANEAHGYIMDMIDQLARMAKKAGHTNLSNDLRAITSQFRMAD